MALIVAPDCETTGIDLYHACRPYFVTICHSDSPDKPLYWPWRVNPLDRKAIVIREDVAEIADWLERADEIVFQNAKFDIRALVSVGLKWKEKWWKKVHDILLSGHLLGSGDNLYLDDQSLKYLRIDIRPFEKELQRIVTLCRGICRRQYKDWMIANKEGLEGFPSIRSSSSNEDNKLWKWDTWLPTELAHKLKYPQEHEYFQSLLNYALTDSTVTLRIREVHRRMMEDKGVTPLYEESRKLVKTVYEMERDGITYSEKRMDNLYAKYLEAVKESEAVCVRLSNGELTELPKGGRSDKLVHFLFETLKLPVVKKTESGLPSTDKDAMAEWRNTIDPASTAGTFLKHLARTRKCKTACTQMESYKRFAIPMRGGWLKLHSSLNLTATDTLRGSSERPSQQTVSKQGYEDIAFEGFKLDSIRSGFGPAPGREWWSADYENIELRIPAYEADEQEMIQLFERPNDPPYYGSQHLLIAHIIWPKEFEECLRNGWSFKDKYKATLYQWTKNGDFAVQYNAQEKYGTADRAYHLPGAHSRINARFNKVKKLSDSLIATARRTGYVTTMVDREIGIGYPLAIPRNSWGRIKPTTPLSYHTQGTAMWCTRKAMRRCSNFLEQWNNSEEAMKRIVANVKRGFERKGYYITMQIHDELVFDFPKGETPTQNLDVILKCKELMEESGEDIGIPLTVDYSYHPDNWAKHTEIEEAVSV
jgi:DNA polymerase I-like protein with 3'-5' exonuclease and polymerase domains